MQHVYVLNPKGEYSKTTISKQLATYYSGEGLSVLVLDHELQQCVTDWVAPKQDRNGREWRVPSPFIPKDGIFDPAAMGCELVIHDMPAAWSLASPTKLISTGDKVLIPVQPSTQDIRACVRFVMSLYRSGALASKIRVGLVAQCVKTGVNYSQILHEFLERQELPIQEAFGDTQAYVRTMDEGLTIFDVGPSDKQHDIGQWRAIINWLEIKPPELDETGALDRRSRS